jgi:hypothetical protein
MNLPDFQDDFFSNPGTVAARELGIKSVSESTIGTSNRLVFNLLSDPHFNKWAEDFQSTIQSDFPMLSSLESMDDITAFIRAKENKDRLVQAFSESAIKHLAPESFEEILREGTLDQNLIRAEPDIAVVPLTFVAVIVVITVAIVAARTEAISRMNVKIAINKLNERQLNIIAEANR